jgi:hypothetical protein
MLLLNKKSTNEVFLAPFWYMNVESKVGEPISLAMLKLMTKSQTPSIIGELIKCLSKMLDGSPVACGSRIGKGPDVVSRVSFSTAIMSLVLSFKSWKLNNSVFTSFWVTSCIWSWHSISWSVEKLCVFLMYMYSWDMRIWCLSNLWCSSLLPLCQQGVFLFRVERTKRLWHDCSSSSSLGNRTWTRCESISLNYLPSAKNSRCHTSLLCHEVGKAKRSNKY